MDSYGFNDEEVSKFPSPFFFPNSLGESDINNDSFDNEENAIYQRENVNIFKNEYNDYEDKTNFISDPHLKDSSQKEKEKILCSVDDIKENLGKSKYDSSTKKELIENIISLKEEEEFMKSGKNIKINDDKKNSYEKEYEKKKKEQDPNYIKYLKKKRGRKTSEHGLKIHDKYSSNNIIKKSKCLIINEFRNLVNRILGQDLILKINYEAYNNVNKEKNLDLLKKPLKDFFSLDVSKKYLSEKKEFNANLIKKVFSKNNDKNDKDDIIKFLFQITLNDWIDLFTYKININTLKDKYKDKNDYCEKIQENFHGVENLLKTILEKENKYYYSLFALHIFNFQTWFELRKGRIHRSKK